MNYYHGEITFKELICAILAINEKIEIIAFVEEKTAELQSFLYSNGVYKIFQNNEVDFDTLVKSICGDVEQVPKISESFNNELEKINKILRDKYSLDKIGFEEMGKVISFTGAYNSGKTTMAALYAKEYARLGKKVLTIDFDVYNDSLHHLFAVEKYNSRESTLTMDFKKQIRKISKNEDILCVMDLLFSNENKVDFVNLEEMIKDFKCKYDVILIDTTSDYKYKYLTRIFNISDEIIFVVVPTRLDLRKGLSLFEILKVDFKIPSDKITMILNKETGWTIKAEIISSMYDNFNISGVFQFDIKVETDLMDKKFERRLEWIKA